MPHFGQAVKTRIWILLDEICLVLQGFNLLGGRLWTFLEGGLVRKEDSRLRGNVLSMFIKLSHCVRPTPGTTPKKTNADGHRRLDSDAP
jgi:hypothetical protein